MTRKLENWIESYKSYTINGEAPEQMNFWTGISVLAGALRRKVWYEQPDYTMYPSFYIIMVAPPGIVGKTTTGDVGMSLLRKVPGINFGPDIVTWQSLLKTLPSFAENFQVGDAWIPMSAMTLVAGELGNLIDPTDQHLINAYITLWDGKAQLSKATKNSGNDFIEGPCINMLGCTTPQWIIENISKVASKGGFTSRCIFVYADAKARYAALPSRTVDPKRKDHAQDLINDLEHISNLSGPFTMTEEAQVREEKRYEIFWKYGLGSQRNHPLEGYAARHQTHLIKTAMVISAARSDSMIIEMKDMQLAECMLSSLEPDMHRVFSRVGISEDSQNADSLLSYIKSVKYLSYADALRYIHLYFPYFSDFAGILEGLIRAGYVSLGTVNNEQWLRYTGPEE